MSLIKKVIDAMPEGTSLDFRFPKRNFPAQGVRFTGQTFDDWNACGRRINKGERASGTNSAGYPTFTIKQTHEPKS